MTAREANEPPAASIVPSFDPNIGTPDYIYVKIADHIEARIEAGELPPDRRIPTERALATEYDVSVVTARNATAVLRRRGLIRSIPVKGNYVLARDRPRPRTPTVVSTQPVSEAARRLGGRVRARRRELGWSQERLADQCGIHWSMVGQIERGQRNVGLHNILKLVTALEIDPGHLLRGLYPPDRDDHQLDRPPPPRTAHEPTVTADAARADRSPNPTRPGLSDRPEPQRPVPTGTAAKHIGVDRGTLHRWWQQGDVEPTLVTPNGRARWDLDELVRQLRDGGRHDS